MTIIILQLTFNTLRVFSKCAKIYMIVPRQVKKYNYYYSITTFSLGTVLYNPQQFENDLSNNFFVSAIFFQWSFLYCFFNKIKMTKIYSELKYSFNCEHYGKG